VCVGAWQVLRLLDGVCRASRYSNKPFLCLIWCGVAFTFTMCGVCGHKYGGLLLVDLYFIFFILFSLLPKKNASLPSFCLLFQFHSLFFWFFIFLFNPFIEVLFVFNLVFQFQFEIFYFFPFDLYYFDLWYFFLALLWKKNYFQFSPQF